MFKKLNNQNGFTMIELICTISLLGIVGAMSYNIFIGTNMTQRKSEQLHLANNIAQEVMEDVIANSYVGDYAYENFDVDIKVVNNESDGDDDSGGQDIEITTPSYEIKSPTDEPGFINEDSKTANFIYQVVDYIDLDANFYLRVADKLISTGKKVQELSVSELAEIGIHDKADVEETRKLEPTKYEKAYIWFYGMTPEQIVGMQGFLQGRINSVQNDVRLKKADIKTQFGGAAEGETFAALIDLYINNYYYDGEYSAIYGNDICQFVSYVNKQFLSGNYVNDPLLSKVNSSWGLPNIKQFFYQFYNQSMYVEDYIQTAHGPLLMSKLIENNDKNYGISDCYLLAYKIADLNERSDSQNEDSKTALSFKIWCERVQVENVGNWGNAGGSILFGDVVAGVSGGHLNYVWNNYTNPIPIGIQTIDLTLADGSVSRVYNNMTVSVTGGLSYSSVPLGVRAEVNFGEGRGEGKLYYYEDGKKKEHIANLNFYNSLTWDSLDENGDSHLDASKNPASHDWLKFNGTPTGQGGSGSYEEISGESTTTKWHVSIDEMSKIVVKVKDQNSGKILSTLVSQSVTPAYSESYVMKDCNVILDIDGVQINYLARDQKSTEKENDFIDAGSTILQSDIPFALDSRPEVGQVFYIGKDTSRLSIESISTKIGRTQKTTIDKVFNSISALYTNDYKFRYSDGKSNTMKDGEKPIVKKLVVGLQGDLSSSFRFDLQNAVDNYAVPVDPATNRRYPLELYIYDNTNENALNGESYFDLYTSTQVMDTDSKKMFRNILKGSKIVYVRVPNADKGYEVIFKDDGTVVKQTNN